MRTWHPKQSSHKWKGDYESKLGVRVRWTLFFWFISEPRAIYIMFPKSNPFPLPFIVSILTEETLVVLPPQPESPHCIVVGVGRHCALSVTSTVKGPQIFVPHHRTSALPSLCLCDCTITTPAARVPSQRVFSSPPLESYLIRSRPPLPLPQLHDHYDHRASPKR